MSDKVNTEGYVFVPMPNGLTYRTIKIPTTGTDSPLTGDEQLILHLHDKVATLEHDLARVTAELAQVREALAGDDYGSLPSDFPTVRMAHTIRQDHNKFRDQVRDTCLRAEKAEAELAVCKEDAERIDWMEKNPQKVKFAITYGNAERHEGSRGNWSFEDANRFHHDAPSLRAAIDAAIKEGS